MTVGLYISNGLEAIIITDPRVSGNQRESDTVNKQGLFNPKDYHGVIFGSGNSQPIMQMFYKTLKTCSGKDIGAYVGNLQKAHEKERDKEFSSYLKKANKKINTKSLVINNPDERKGYTASEKNKLLEEWDQEYSKSKTEFLTVGFDKKQNKISSFYFGDNTGNSIELFQDYQSIGSGSDAAGLHFGTKLVGVDTKKLKLEDLMYFAINAYSESTHNQGVGGTPKITIISKEGNKNLSKYRTKALTNLSGAYLSRENEEQLITDNTINIMKGIINDKSPDYKNIAETIGLNKETLITKTIPYSEWQESSNSKRFN